MKARLGKKELAQAFGVSPRTVERWVARGCPCERERGKVLFSEAAVRRWQEREAGSGRPGRPAHADALREEARPPTPAAAAAPAATPTGTAPRERVASKQSLAKAELARKISIARKNELEVAAEKSLKDLGLDAKIREAASHEDLFGLNQEVAALIASGGLLPTRGQALQRVLAEARQNLRAQLDAPAEGDPERTFLCTEDAATLARVFDSVVSDEHREAILRFAHERARDDLHDHPDVDGGAP